MASRSPGVASGGMPTGLVDVARRAHGGWPPRGPRARGPDLDLPRRNARRLVEGQGQIVYEREAWRFDRR